MGHYQIPKTRMFQARTLKKFQKEISWAYGVRASRAAFGAIVRDNIDKLSTMTRQQWKEFCRKVRVPESYHDEIAKEVALQNYIGEYRKAYKQREEL
jgi:hypothetical protein